MTVPRGQRLHIALFGRRNVGKSSLINALTGQELAIVSDVPGTTTDPVVKAMEILPLGPVVVIDTAGIDDVGVLGELRKKKSYEVLSKTDLLLLVVDPEKGFGEYEEDLIKKTEEYGTPVIYVVNKIDLYPNLRKDFESKIPDPKVFVSAKTGEGIEELKHFIVKYAPKDWSLPTIVGDLINEGDLVICVVPVDKGAPKGRLILPQQMVIRDIIDHGGTVLVVRERELNYALNYIKIPPSLVITDASVYTKVVAEVPQKVRLTSFSILFARYKGDLQTLVEGALSIDDLRPGDKVLIAEACTHHPLEDDIGRVKIPRWLRTKVGGNLEIEVKVGSGPLPKNLREYALIVHCGACMLNRKEMLSRIIQARKAGVPMVNYGVALAFFHGILTRVLSPFPHLQSLVTSTSALDVSEAETIKCIKNLVFQRSQKIHS